MTPVSTLQQQIAERIATLNGMSDYPSLFAPVHYLLAMGGKRMRPALVLMGCELFGGKSADAMCAALAVEVFHNFTLMHDDIMDKAPLRRGQITVHEKWNANTAILSGDAMLIQAYQLLCQSPSPLLFRLLQVFNTTAIGVCAGQQLDMDFESRQDVTVDEYVEMIRLKTAILFGGALSLGAIIAGANDENIHHLRLFGEQLGISFQLRDDYLDTFGDPKVFGKQTGGDILADKKTFLHIRTCEKASDGQRARLREQYGIAQHKDQKIQTVKGIMETLGVAEDALAFSEKHYQTALQHLSRLSVENDKKQYAQAFADGLMNRQV